jgi:hypothetical protein
MLMVLCPTSNDGIKHENESSRRQCLVLCDDFPDLFQVCMHILSCWFNQQFALLSCFVLAYVLTQEIEPVLNMGDAGFLGREFSPSFCHEGFDEGFDILLKQFFFCCCYDKIIGVSHKIDFCRYPFYCRFWEALP